MPGTTVTLAFQLVQPLAEFTLLVQALLLTCNHTLATPTFSLAVPVTLKTLLLQRSWASGAVMLSVGFVTSTKFAVRLRFAVIVKRNVAVLVLISPVHPVKRNPGAAVAVSVYG